MKKSNYLILLIGIFSLVACSDKIEDTITYTVNEPVFMSKSEFRAPVKISTEAKPISKEGKICLYNGFLYISEPEVGIHIIDNQNPANPKNVGFIKLLGNADLAIQNGVLYADSYIDLVWFDISDAALPKELGRAIDVFPYSLPVTENTYGCDWEKMNEKSKTDIIVGWIVSERTTTVKESGSVWWGWGRVEDAEYLSDAGVNSGTSTGVNGSMSRFVFYGNYLYSVFNNQMSIFNFNDKIPEKAAQDVYVGGNVETIFSYKDNLFMGTPTGMLIYSVQTPLMPTYQSAIFHALGCDPVVVENDKAYITVHSGNMCGQDENTLFIVDVSDVKHPKEIVSYNTMKSPKGLGIDNGTLFLCDDGLKVYNVSNLQTLATNQISHFKNMEGYDVIPHNNVLIMIAQDGIYQYDYSKLNDIKLLSKMPFVK
ncbi:MAG: hypothetical protein QM751_02970 [Paludibacteraceae bacterium]